MQLKQALEKSKAKFITQWFEKTIATYPADTTKILGKDADRFDNPVGAVTRETLEDVFNHILDGCTLDSLETKLDPVIRIRAVQSFTAADAVSFVFALKPIGEQLLPESLILDFHRLVDQIALAAFNRLMQCKEEVFLLKATESKRRIHRAFERAGLVAELSEEELVGSQKS